MVCGVNQYAIGNSYLLRVLQTETEGLNVAITWVVDANIPYTYNGDRVTLIGHAYDNMRQMIIAMRIELTDGTMRTIQASPDGTFAGLTPVSS